MNSNVPRSVGTASRRRGQRHPRTPRPVCGPTAELAKSALASLSTGGARQQASGQLDLAEMECAVLNSMQDTSANSDWFLAQ